MWEELDVDRKIQSIWPQKHQHFLLHLALESENSIQQVFEEAQAQAPSKVSTAIQPPESTQQNSSSMGFYNPQDATKYNWSEVDRLQEWIPSLVERTCMFFFFYIKTKETTK